MAFCLQRSSFHPSLRSTLCITLALSTVVLLSGCRSQSDTVERLVNDPDNYQPPSIFGSDSPLTFKGSTKDLGLERLFGDKKQTESQTFNSTLQSLAQLGYPVTEANPQTGSILTDWVSSPNNPKERSKIDVLFKNGTISPENLTLNVFQQENKAGSWISKAVPQEVKTVLAQHMLQSMLGF